MNSTVIIQTPAQIQPVVQSSSSSDTLTQVIVSVFFPPAAVILNRGCGADAVINFALTCVGYVPGLIHALYIIGREGSGYQEIRSFIDPPETSTQVVYIVQPGSQQQVVQQESALLKNPQGTTDSSVPPPYSPY
ncbi:hypothetical protein BB559_004377 [Furculomyces boomerangus]|uniref:Stress response RCI peptide n=2 Tax=Harpellales TaxID=61421 RepID=A0A2T9YF49_9FUNG|nr:hypothetical protein BB559_004377 [Furculomyces boomerangus]PWA02000.1 hypothetical protein BB558_001869 [Smittium angustum]